MIDGLISGKLYGVAAERTGQNGKTFVTAKVRAATGEGESLFVNVITFSTTAADALLALDDGDSVSLAGTLTPKVWTDKHGDARPALDMVAHAVLTAYHVKRKRAAMQGRQSAPESTSNAEPGSPAHGGVDDSLDDDL
ncbi:single-stranded DNA-binding protein [Burkholderia stagnalis]|jgi:single-stranded DNA-binding protein|uniref:single-stranded DNA-binding protein n=1 Tax=Burkholderia stagnalis TaxID=1503054 RepID=UPI000F5CFE0C|nr:single-stranded DNA-binding protein [Burkholderia stagnalis]RQY25357.1 single-stranded DNA-binding protein [Burkholderia stagnalis]RQZ01498.1 single-stranded DNA-binding protein [Burkholderia stagnalis]RQZ07075.1 single-stranded DNA-binding protein [Burkholderia stagnalis]